MTHPHSAWPAGTPPIQRGSMPAQPWIGLRARLSGQPTAQDTPWQRSTTAVCQYRMPWEKAAQRRRRWLLFWIFGVTVFATRLLWRAQPDAATDLWLAAQMVLFSVLFAWVSAGTVTAVMGFFVTLRGDPHALSTRSAGSAPLAAAARTAVIMPICNEDVGTVFAGLRATCESLTAAGAQLVFDVFVLSDSSDPALRAGELQAWQRLREQLQASGSRLQVYYRWRQHRTRRKAGNVADFCRRWGRNYRYMVVMDADSVMSGDTLVTLARLMEANPRAGILQTAPRTCGHATLHARAQQFGSRVVGRLFTAGMQFWQLGEAHYWGHNAILRVAPFMQHCGLATLPGRGALSGEILSHDFVEAALMRRAGYEVWLVHDLDGSYEQQPAHVLAELQRDRRWCQGNLQNARLLAEPGLRPVHRAMLATGAMAYLSAPLWLLYVVLGAALWLHDSDMSLWTHRNVLLLWLSTALMLMLPRVLGLLAVLLRGEHAAFGGVLRLLGSAVLEATLSVLQAPLRMAAHSLFVIGALTGWKLEWTSPPRTAHALHWADALRRLGPLSMGVLLTLVTVAAYSPATAVWLLPMGLPLLLAVPITVLCSQTRWGQALRDAGWLLVPEETASPSVLQHAWRYARTPLTHRVGMWWADLPRLAQLARQALGPRHTGHGLRGAQRRQRALQLGRQAHMRLSPQEQMRFLSEPHSLRLLHAARVGQQLPGA
jgi:membrane glycosyltransferase